MSFGNSEEEGWSQKPKLLNESMKLNWNFQGVGGGREGGGLGVGGWGFKPKCLCRVWIFSGTKYTCGEFIPVN